MLMVFACAKIFKLFHMDLKSTFLNGYVMEKVYVQQLFSFEDNLNLLLEKALEEEMLIPHFSLRKKKRNSTCTSVCG